MTTELRTKSQVTIPKSIVSSMKLNTGDKLEIFEKDGMICIMPVTIYPKSYVNAIYDEVNAIKADVKAGRKPVFSNIDAMFSELDKA